MSYATQRLSQTVDALKRAFEDEFREMATKELEKLFDSFKSERLPKMIAAASKLVDVETIKTLNRPGVELRFVIVDYEEMRTRLRESVNSC